MIDDLQKASILKRISAYLFDLIMLCVLVVGLASLLSLALGYNQRLDELNSYYEKYENQFGVDFGISYDKYSALSKEELQVYDDAFAAMNKDQDALRSYNLVLNLTLLIVTFSIFLGYFLLEFVVPMFFKNGQTLGKKIFSIGLMRIDSVKVNNVQMFVRTILGKFTIETMIPVLIVMMIFLNSMGIMGIIVIGGIALLQLILIAVTKTNSAIHDRLANTVVVDMPSQMIFDTEEDMVEFKKQRHKEMADSREY